MIKKYNDFILEFNAQERVDNLLDKISKSGLSSLSKSEKDFLDSFSKGEEEEVNKKLNIDEGISPLVSSDGIFEFKLQDIEYYSSDSGERDDIMVYGELFYDGEEYYGKFNFSKGDKGYYLSYYIFNLIGSPGGVGGFDEGYFEDQLEDNNNVDSFDDFIDEVKLFFIDK